ncbi:replication initiation protein [Dactylosporangium fulvum]|uniref:Replication initiation protein n=2 Tax=Dactylosporangium fulvum TaxID=53359 RepID=A0ABY5WEB8_9ACTN|nr:replication initiator [Dactylosporangium fulvum]UWP87767.1 replication initiation protein [Dactylosporangium fulvum]
MLIPLAANVVKDMAAEYGVCLRPVGLRRTDLATGQTEIIDVPCGATREDKCPPCAKRARRLRKTQIREGWHRTDEPAPGPQPATEGQRALISLRAHLEHYRDQAVRASEWDQVEEIDDAIREVEEAIATEGLRGTVAPPHRVDHVTEPKRQRSTRRRQDAPALPRQKVQPRTVGRVYTAPDGTEYRPSMWLTVTLDSYGPVRPDGSPVDPTTYDYRRAALDAIAFPRLLDRFWQNLRRCVGWNVQYAGCVEPQRRLAPHAHFAIRGTLPRAVLREVAAATYHQVWWPKIDAPTCRPVWDSDAETWCDAETGLPLTTWDEALDAIDADPDAEPAHVIRFGTHVHAEGVTADDKNVDRTIGYITKYITKSAADCHAITTDRQRDHLERFWQELRVIPCSDRCANWLLYGIQPKKAHGKLRPGNCKGRVHQRSTLGIGGRRILVSRDWSGKTLADHRYDARAWVRALLGASAGVDQVPVVDEPEPGTPVPVAWELARPNDPDMPPMRHRLLRALAQRIQWRNALNAAKDRAAQYDGNTTEATDNHGVKG